MKGTKAGGYRDYLFQHLKAGFISRDPANGLAWHYPLVRL
jgi:hypothetical protein